jgi:hypothetical protein
LYTDPTGECILTHPCTPSSLWNDLIELERARQAGAQEAGQKIAQALSTPVVRAGVALGEGLRRPDQWLPAVEAFHHRYGPMAFLHDPRDPLAYPLLPGLNGQFMADQAIGAGQHVAGIVCDVSSGDPYRAIAGLSTLGVDLVFLRVSGVRGPAIGNSTRQPGPSVWDIPGIRPRGELIESMVGRSPFLVSNFPVIDRFANGVATSIKSLDLRAATYQDVTKLSRKVLGYIDDMATYQGQPRRWGGVQITQAQITGRALDLVIPAHGVAHEQLLVLAGLQNYAHMVGVRLNLIRLP